MVVMPYTGCLISEQTAIGADRRHSSMRDIFPNTNETARDREHPLIHEQVLNDFGRNREANFLSLDHDLRVKRYNYLEDLSTLVPAWENLLADCPDVSIFSTWEWLSSWWRAFGTDQKLLVLAFLDSSGHLVGLAPLSIGNHRALGKTFRVIRLMGDGSNDSDNLDFPVRPGHEEGFAKTLLNYLKTEVRGWDFCQFSTLPADSRAGAFLSASLNELNWNQMEHRTPRSLLELPESWDDYLKRVSPKERDNLRYYQRRIERRYNVRVYKCTEESDFPATLGMLFRLHRLRWQARGQSGSFDSPARRQFYDEMGRLFLRRQWLELWTLELDERPVAAQFSFRYRDTVYSLQQGFDPEFASVCVQDVLRIYILQRLMCEGVRRYDFLMGTDARKIRWGANPMHYLNVLFARPYTWGSFYLRVLHDYREGKECLRARLPASIWTSLHRLNLLLRNSSQRKSA